MLAVISPSLCLESTCILQYSLEASLFDPYVALSVFSHLNAAFVFSIVHIIRHLLVKSSHRSASIWLSCMSALACASGVCIIIFGCVCVFICMCCIVLITNNLNIRFNFCPSASDFFYVIFGHLRSSFFSISEDFLCMPYLFLIDPIISVCTFSSSPLFPDINNPHP